jgi:uncharacterized protein (TIGR00661 family)
MRILYGVTGEGLGHAMRAAVLIEHLAAGGHRVAAAASGRALSLLRAHGAEVVPIDGLQLVYHRGGLERVRTLMENARRAPGALAKNVGAALGEVAAFDPELVVTDFDSFSYAVARLLDRPAISVDHQHVLSRFVHPPEVLRRVSYDFPLARGVVRRKLPRCDRYIVTSFFFPASRPDCARDTRLVGPILRRAVELAQPVEGEHVLVYQTGSGDPRLLGLLGALGRHRFRVYSRAPVAAAPNVVACPFSEAGFVADLASARAVIANGGYTTLAEAACLGKPVVSLPVRHQGEQELNAAWLEHQGLGVALRRPSLRGLERALDQAIALRPPLRPRGATALATRALDQAIAEVA